MTIHIIITMLLLLAFLIGSIWFAKRNTRLIQLSWAWVQSLSLSLRRFWKTGAYLDFASSKRRQYCPLARSPLSILSMAQPWQHFLGNGSSCFLQMVGEKRSLEKADALAYGLGHGGLELIFLGLTSLLNLYIVLSAVQTPESTGYAITV